MLNIVACACTWSQLCHVEVAVGESQNAEGALMNVVRVFNDPTGVELCSRTGRNPNFSYVQLGCSRLAAERMLAFSRAQVGKPFSQIGMARSIVYPRKTDGRSWYCAELVAAVLQVGGLMHQSCNPGAATPASLHEMYAPRGAVSANPYKLTMLRRSREEEEPLLQLQLGGTMAAQKPRATAARAPHAVAQAHPTPRARVAATKPPAHHTGRMQFRAYDARAPPSGAGPMCELTLNSLTPGGRR